MKTSEVLNKAADHIQEYGWGQGPASMYGQAGICVMGAIHLANYGHLGDEYDDTFFCDAGQAVYRYLVEHDPDLELDLDTMWSWNDDLPDATGATEVIAVLRATALIESARESQDAAFATYAENGVGA